MTSASLGGAELATAVPEAEVLRVARQLTGGRRNVHVDVPGRAGSWTFPEEPGDRTLVLELDIAGATFADRRDAVRRLADWCDLGYVARLVIDDEPDRFHDAILDDSATVDEWLLAANAVAVPFRCAPYALAITPTEAAVTATGSPDSGAFTNLGTSNVEALPVVEITPTDGTLTSFTWTLNDTATSFGELVNSGDTVTISALADIVTREVDGDAELTGAYLANLVAMGTVSGDFGRIVPGANTWSLEWTGTATTVAVGITWRERYR